MTSDLRLTAAGSSEASWLAFRSDAARQVPGLPANAGPQFDVTRHGTLDHVQRVLVRALVLDLAPDLDRRAVEACRTLGDLAALVGDAARPTGTGLPRSTLVHGAHRNARVALVPVGGSHMPALYTAATAPGSGFRWRFRGRTPSPEEFHTSLFTGVVVQYVVEAVDDGTPVGLVVAYDEDLSGSHCHIGFLRIDDHDRVPGGTMEGLLLLIDLVFATFTYRKVFADLPEYNLPLVDGMPGETLRSEGRMREFHWHGGRFWDRCFFSLSREAWEHMAEGLVR